MASSATNLKKGFEDVLGGLFLMIAFTLVWAVIGEVALSGRDHWGIGVLFAIALGFFLVSYLKFYSVSKKIKDIAVAESVKDKTKSKWFNIIFIVEGVAIFVVVNVLNNTGHGNYFISCFALIVGLHFFPLGKIMERKAYYFMGGFICLGAILGIMLTSKGFPTYEITGIVGTWCAFATSAYSITLINRGNQLVLLSGL
jgi:F0F1-type ATP synthase membrane subunit c/vacuolar-type H+-ATPase subunit K